MRSMPSQEPLRWAWPYVRAQRVRLGAVLVLSLLSTLLSLVIPLLVRELVDRALLARDTVALQRMTAAFFISTALSFGLGFASTLIYTRASAEALFAMRLDVYRHLQRLSPRFFSARPLGDIVSRLNNDVAEVQRVAAESVLASLSNAFSIVGALAMLAVLAPKLLLVAIAFVPPSLAALAYFRRRTAARVKTLRERSADIGSFLIDTLSASRLVAASRSEQREADRFGERNRGFVRALMSMQKQGALLGGVPSLILAAGAGVVFLVGGGDVIAGRLSLGTFVAFMAYQVRLMPPLQALMGLYAALATASVSLGRVREILDEPAEIVDSANARALPDARGDVEFADVSFSFDRDVVVLQDVSFRVTAGETVAIVGPSGAGKSTIADLLVRFFDPKSGSVSLDGHDLRGLRLSDVRRHVALVEQTPLLFHATVEENIRYASPEASAADVRAAADAAGMGPLLDAWPLGLRTVVGERGTALSAGERQRIAIARALLQDPAVLVLDEPTASLDPQSERAVIDAYSRALSGRTAVVISHRRAIAERADRVVVLEGARVVEAGSARDLLARDGSFASLFRPA